MSTIKEDLIDLFELDKLSPEKSVEMVDRLSKLVFQSVLVKVLPMLSEKDFDEYERIVESKQGGEVLFGFLNEKVPNLGEIIKEESEALKAELAGEFKQVGL